MVDDDDDDWDETGEKYDRRAAMLARGFAQSPAVIARHRGQPPRLLIRSGEPRAGGKLRVTTFMVDGPWGHAEYANDDKLYEDLARDGYESVEPASDDEVMAWTSTPEFVRGSAATSMVQAENTLRYLASKHGDHDILRPIFDRGYQLAADGTTEAYQAAAEYFQDALRGYVKNPELYIHYSSRSEPPRVPPRAMERFAGGTGPLGVYAYQEDAKQKTFGTGRSHAFILEPTVAVLKTSEYTDTDLWRDLSALSKLVDISWATKMWNKLRDRGELRHADVPFAKLWYVVGHVTSSTSDDPDDRPAAHQSACNDPALARKLLLELGHKVIDDRRGLMYSSEPEQAVFLTDDSFRVVSTDVRKNGAMRSKVGDRNSDDFAPNPAWVTRSITGAFDTINAEVPAKWHPKLAQARHKKGESFVAKLREYGCGAYGCVLPTLDERTVLKVTTDTTEAEFAGELSSTLVTPICVDYRLVMKLAVKYQNRPVFLLWRESADDVGQMKDNSLINVQHKAAQSAYAEMYKTGTSSRGAITAWRNAIHAMTGDPALAFLARGMLKVFDEQGIFFGDVHGGNVGRCVRGDKLEWVIIDPGHVSVVKK